MRSLLLRQPALACLLIACVCSAIVAPSQAQDACQSECVRSIYDGNCGGASCITGVSSSEEFQALCGPTCINAISGGSMLDCLMSIGGSTDVHNIFVRSVQDFCHKEDPFKRPDQAPAIAPESLDGAPSTGADGPDAMDEAKAPGQDAAVPETAEPPTVETTPVEAPTVSPAVSPAVAPSVEEEAPSVPPTTEEAPVEPPTVIDEPTVEPDSVPEVEPDVQPDVEPEVEPTEPPTETPTEEPAEGPEDDLEEPAVEPEEEPMEEPAEEPYEEPFEEPLEEPFEEPIEEPEMEPEMEPEIEPEFEPEVEPEEAPAPAPEPEEAMPSIIDEDMDFDDLEQEIMGMLQDDVEFSSTDTQIRIGGDQEDYYENDV